jgi:hypothetical protein
MPKKGVIWTFGNAISNACIRSFLRDLCKPAKSFCGGVWDDQLNILLQQFLCVLVVFVSFLLQKSQKIDPEIEEATSFEK